MLSNEIKRYERNFISKFNSPGSLGFIEYYGYLSNLSLIALLALFSVILWYKFYLRTDLNLVNRTYWVLKPIDEINFDFYASTYTYMFPAQENVTLYSFVELFAMLFYKSVHNILYLSILFPMHAIQKKILILYRILVRF